MTKKKSEEQHDKILQLRSGENFPVIREDGLYWYCAETRFLKTNPDVLKVEAAVGKEHDDA